jgi:hypothetical protein
LLGATNGIYKSTDGGATFQRILNGFPTNIGVFAWSLTASGGNVVAAVTVLFSTSEALDAIFIRLTMEALGIRPLCL